MRLRLRLRLDLGPILRSLSRQRSASSLVVLELATGFATISCVLLASGWYEQLATRSSGYEASELVMATVHQPADTTVDEARARDAASAIEAQRLTSMRALPEVAAVSTVSAGMLDQRGNIPVQVSGVEATPTARSAVGWTVYTSPAIAEVLGLRLVEGAFPRDLPTADLTLVTVITRCLRERLFPDDPSVVGRVVRAVDAPPARVVAVIEDVVLRDPWNAHGSCVSIRFGWPPDERESRFLLRARPGQRAQVMAGLRAVLGPTTPDRLVAIEPFDPKDAHPTRMARGLVVNLGVFGAIVIVTALLGTLTVSSFLVYERTRSIGIRRALGAAPPDIVRYFLVETTILTGFGVALGLVFTAGVFLVMQGLYPGVHLSLPALVLTAILLWLGATLGALHPARQAARIPPWTAARSTWTAVEPQG